jgi:hypothetical protein
MLRFQYNMTAVKVLGALCAVLVFLILVSCLKRMCCCSGGGGGRRQHESWNGNPAHFGKDIVVVKA